MPLGFVQDVLGMGGGPRLSNRYQQDQDRMLNRLREQSQGLGLLTMSQTNQNLGQAQQNLVGALNSGRGGELGRLTAMQAGLQGFGQMAGNTLASAQTAGVKERLGAQQQYQQALGAAQEQEMLRYQAARQAFEDDRRRQAQALGGLASLVGGGGMLG